MVTQTRGQQQVANEINNNTSQGVDYRQMSPALPSHEQTGWSLTERSSARTARFPSARSPRPTMRSPALPSQTQTGRSHTERSSARIMSFQSARGQRLTMRSPGLPSHAQTGRSQTERSSARIMSFQSAQRPRLTMRSQTERSSARIMSFPSAQGPRLTMRNGHESCYMSTCSNRWPTRSTTTRAKESIVPPNGRCIESPIVQGVDCAAKWSRLLRFR
jgi:hypothetical protein